jgi:hypothetical protein
MSINLEYLRDMTLTLTSFECRNNDTTGGGALHGTGQTSISRGAQVAKISKVWRCSPSSLSTARLTVSRINNNEVLVQLSLFLDHGWQEESGGVSRGSMGKAVQGQLVRSCGTS